MIRIENLTKRFENVAPLQNVSLEIQDGEVVSIIGPSGTGKSTLLRCINMLDEPTEGKIFIDEIEITDKKNDTNKIRQRMGMVFQSFNLFSHLNIIENIMLAPTKLLGKSKQDAYDEAIELLKMVGLCEKADNYPDELSGGQKQRVAIARTLAMQPSIILFDEPTSALDPTMVGEVLTVIKNLAKKGYTILIVTHEMKFAHDVSTRVLYIDEGNVYEDGPPSQIFDNPQKEKTQNFIKRLKRFELEISSKNFDFIGTNTKIEEFGRTYAFSSKQINNISLLFEEICVQSIIASMPKQFDLKFNIDYFEADEAIKLKIMYDGDEFNALESCDELSLMIIKKLTKSLEYSFSDKNTIDIVL